MKGARDGHRDVGPSSGQAATGSTSGQPAIPDEEQGDIRVSAPRGGVRGSQSDIAGTSITQPTIPDDQSEGSAGTAPPLNQGVYQDILVQCNAIIEEYRKGEVSKASVYAGIQSKLSTAFGHDKA